MLVAALPLAAFALLWLIFRAGVPRDLPVALLDLDHSTLSRQVARMVEASPVVAVVRRPADATAAERLLLEGQVYAVVVLPQHLERTVLRGEAPAVACLTNAQLLLPASLIRRDVMRAVGTLSAGLELRQRLGDGDGSTTAMDRLEPIRVEVHPLFNPQLDYLYYLLTALLPTMLQLFIVIATVDAVAGELKAGTAGQWLDVAGGSAWRALIGKLLPASAISLGVAAMMVAFLYVELELPVRGNALMLVAATALFVLAYQAIGALLAVGFANLRLATSAAALYSAPAFAFVGITFPTMAMPGLARAWGELLPLTHYLRLVVEQVVRGAPIAASTAELVVLLGFSVVALPAAVWRLGRVAANPRWWGRV